MLKYFSFTSVALILLFGSGPGPSTQSDPAQMGETGWIVANSSIAESDVLTTTGDWTTLTVTFPNGNWLVYDIVVVSEEPLAYSIRLTGDLKGQPDTLQTPFKRELKIKFHEDGTVTGSGRSIGPDFNVPVTITGTYHADRPAVALPAEVTSTLQIDRFDPATGHWSGQSVRKVDTAHNATAFPARGEAFYGLLHGVVRVNGEPAAFNGSVLILGTGEDFNPTTGVMTTQRVQPQSFVK